MTQPKPLTNEERAALRRKAVLWATRTAYEYGPGIIVTAIVDEQMFSYETDKHGTLQHRNT